jgi:pimeloyl-ACP methyl ester carboxylesterase
VAEFKEGFVQADGFHIRYMEAGEGPVLVHLHGGGGLRLTPAHDLLSRRFRVIVFEMPGFGADENTRTKSMPEMAATMVAATAAMDLGHFRLMGTSFGGKVALWMAVQNPGLITALILEGSGAIRPEGHTPVSGSPEEIARRLYAHPERMAPMRAVDPALAARRRALTVRLLGPGRDAALEAAMRGLGMPVLVLFGTRDGVIPPEMGRLYKDLIPDAHLVFVYDAGHEIGSERPEAFVEVVGDFLERNDAFVINRLETVLLP